MLWSSCWHIHAHQPRKGRRQPLAKNRFQQAGGRCAHSRALQAFGPLAQHADAVSYTHLTLPTICSV
eukprot:9986771-Alexandrium_andersonii.AAC.1